MHAAVAALLLVPVFYVGDSLGVGTMPRLIAELPGLPIDGNAMVGRTSAQGLSVLRSGLRRRHEVVIFDLGTNDASPETLARNLRGARDLAAGRTLVTFTINKPGAGPFNRAVRSFASSAPGVVLVDWHSAAGRAHLLAGDGIHTSVAGYGRRAGLVAGRLKAQAAQGRPHQRPRVHERQPDQAPA
jgi:lysophospholipase L1-like esterase